MAAAVEGGVDQLEAVRHGGDGVGVHRHGHDFFQERLVGLRADDGDETGLDGLVIGHGPDAGENVDLLQLFRDGVGVLGRQLCAVLPVNLVAVVLLGVVAGGDIDARLAAVVTHGEAQLRSGTQGVKNPDLDAGGGADLGGGFGKLHAVETAVHGDSHATLLGLLALGADDVGEALSGVTDHIDVHVVQAHGHGAPQSGGAELQRTVEAALNFLGIVLDGLQFGVLLGSQHVAVQPFLIFLLIIHDGSVLLLSCE